VRTRSSVRGTGFHRAARPRLSPALTRSALSVVKCFGPTEDRWGGFQ
jgi:hypothetical protein